MFNVHVFEMQITNTGLAHAYLWMHFQVVIQLHVNDVHQFYEKS